MQIRNLSRRDLLHCGEILSQCPEDPSLARTRLEISAEPEIPRYEADGPVVLDYVSGMSLLVIHREEAADIFYLDRVVSLQSGTCFSLMPMDDSCCVDLLSSPEAPPRVTEYVSVASLENQGKSLQFERIYTFLYQECTHDFYFRGEKHKPYELVYIDRGELHNLVRGQDILLGQQDFMIIDSNDWHTQYSDLPVSFLTVSFWAGEVSLSAITNKRFPMRPQFKSIFKKMLTQNEQDAYSSEYMESLMKILLLELMQDTKADSAPQYPTSSHWENEIVDRAMQLISQNLHRKLSLDELAEMVHVSVPYLYKLFQVHLGTSPGKYIAKIRIEECKMLLREGQMTMGQIATRMGFSSQQQFSRQFSALCGISPTQYLRSLR
ncbi:MAG: helix-turn-helix transcriptional regulator [Oscillospiraceae bacterium]|nr:helix-turn-helix transcriptional regulator [Oscillospiraceae bacterium]